MDDIMAYGMVCESILLGMGSAYQYYRGRKEARDMESRERENLGSYLNEYFSPLSWKGNNPVVCYQKVLDESITNGKELMRNLGRSSVLIEEGSYERRKP